MLEFNLTTKAAELPLQWNELAESYFQQSHFLIHTEKYNSCNQRYYMCLRNNELLAAAIVYSLQIDLLTFIRIMTPVKMQIVGIPCSVSSQGIFGNARFVTHLRQYIYKVEKGFVLFLNLKEKSFGNSTATGKTLPTIILHNDFRSWNDYYGALRSNYRRRLNKILLASKVLQFEKLPCSEFTEEMHELYLNVYKRSKGKLEKLSFGFLKNLPADFQLTVCRKNGKTIGWNIALLHAQTYYFFLGGIDYSNNKEDNTYLSLLTQLINDGINAKALFIELGQTAEIAKMRMGGIPQPLYLEAYNSNKMLNKILGMFSPMLEYRRKLENTNALKEMGS